MNWTTRFVVKHLSIFVSRIIGARKPPFGQAREFAPLDFQKYVLN